MTIRCMFNGKQETKDALLSSMEYKEQSFPFYCIAIIANK